MGLQGWTRVTTTMFGAQPRQMRVRIQIPNEGAGGQVPDLGSVHGIPSLQLDLNINGYA